MSLTFKAEKISGAVDESFLSKVYSKHIAFEDGGSGLLVFCALVKINNDEGSASVTSVLNESFESDCKKIADHKEDIFDGLVSIRDADIERFSHSNVEISFAVAIFLHGAVYIAKSGDNIKVGVVRPPKTFEVKFLEGSGKVAPGDLVLISTSKFVDTFDWNVFATDEKLVFEDAIDGLATDVSALEGQSEIGAVFVQVNGAHQESMAVKDEEPLPSVEVDDADIPDDNQVSQNEAGLPAKKKGFLSSLAGLVVGEVRELRLGDIRAIFRLRRNLVLLAILFVLALVGSGFMTLKGEMDAKKQAQFEGYMLSANTKYSEAIGIVDLNRARARELLVEAGREVDLALSVMTDNAEATGLKRQIEEKLAQTANLATVEFSTFYDSGDGVGAISRGSDSYFVFGDAGIIEVDDEGGEIRKMNEEGVNGGFVYDDSVFSLVEGRVFKFTSARESEEIVSSSEMRDMAVFLGNVYVLGADQIYKYVPIADGYAKSAPYLEQVKTFGTESRMAIDGSVWVSVDSEIFKYTRGVLEDFEISGVSGLGTLGEIYTNVDVDNLYVVDRSNSAMLVISKDGVVSKTYNSAEFAKATDLLVDEEGGKMYIGSGTRVLVADL